MTVRYVLWRLPWLTEEDKSSLCKFRPVRLLQLLTLIKNSVTHSIFGMAPAQVRKLICSSLCHTGGPLQQLVWPLVDENHFSESSLSANQIKNNRNAKPGFVFASLH